MGPTADLQGLIVDAVTDDAAAASVASRLAEAFGSISATLQVYGTERAEMLSYAGFGASLIEQQVAYYWRVDPWVPGYRARAGLGAVASHAVISDSEMLRSEVYNDLFRRHDDQFRCVAFMEPMGAGDFLCFGAHRRRNDPDFDPRAIDKADALRSPLLRMAVGRRRLEAGRGRLAERVVDDEPDAVAVVDEGGRVVFANAAAARLFEGGPLRMVGGRLAAGTPASPARWRRLCARPAPAWADGC